MSSDAARRVASAYRVFVAYKSKKTVKTKDGEKRTVYEYGPRQIQKRHEEKAKRLEKLKGHLSALRAQVRKDLTCTDDKTCQTAIAIALMDETFERVGNPQSAEEGHYGVTGWQVKHVTFKGGTATLSYVGKSGVKQKKKVDDSKLVRALKKLTKGKGEEDDILAEVEAEDVNTYLSKYDITAKDIRGFHANDRMVAHLKAIRKKGPELPRDRKEKDKILKEEFNRALDATADEVGHEASTLRGQYLVPKLEDNYLHDGSVLEKFTE